MNSIIAFLSQTFNIEPSWIIFAAFIILVFSAASLVEYFNGTYRS